MNKLRLSHAQVRAVIALNQGHAPSTEYTKMGRPQTWQALKRKGIVEEVPFDELAFNKRASHEIKKWVRLTESGKAALVELLEDKKGQTFTISG